MTFENNQFCCQRNERLRENINDALNKSSDLRQFEKIIGARGYEIIKGRGISFADEKKVKVKRSEVNYSLQTLEPILEKQRKLSSNWERKGVNLWKIEMFNHEISFTNL
jgi:hypothetical protein